MDQREETRKKVAKLKKFYISVLKYLFFNTLFILIWLIFDQGNVFWPKYVMLIWGGSLAFKAYRADLLSFLSTYTKFLSKEWEERKIEELLAKEKPSSPQKVPLKRDLSSKDTPSKE